MKSLPSFVLLSLVALGLAGCGPKNQETAAASAAQPGSPAAAAPAGKLAALPVLGPAPTWKLRDINGQVVSSDQFKGKILVVDFWATWCGPCRVEIPGYIALQNKYGKDGLAIVGVSLDSAGPEVVKAFATKNKMNYAVVMGDEAVQAAFGGMEAIPTTFLIDREGKIRDRKVGAEETESYEKKIAALLN